MSRGQGQNFQLPAGVGWELQNIAARTAAGPGLLVINVVDTNNDLAQAHVFRTSSGGIQAVYPEVTHDPGFNAMWTAADPYNEVFYKLLHDVNTDDEYLVARYHIVDNKVALHGTEARLSANGGAVGQFEPTPVFGVIDGNFVFAGRRTDDPFTQKFRAWRWNGTTMELAHSLDVASIFPNNPNVCRSMHGDNWFGVVDALDPDFRLQVYRYTNAAGFVAAFIYNPAALFTGTKTNITYSYDPITKLIRVVPESNSVRADDSYFFSIDAGVTALTAAGSVVNPSNLRVAEGSFLDNRVYYRTTDATQVARIAKLNTPITSATDVGTQYSYTENSDVFPVVSGPTPDQAFNQLFKNPNATLNFTYAADDTLNTSISAAGQYGSARAVKPVLGKSYFSMVVRHTDSGAVCGVGLVDSVHDLAGNSDWPGQDTFGISVGSPNGTIYVNGSSIGSVGALAAPNGIEFAVDADLRRIWIRKSGGAWIGGGNPATNTSPTHTLAGTGRIFPAGWVSTAGTIVNRFVGLDTTFANGAVPAGFTERNWHEY
jgi:hypothetical protein